MTGFAINHFFVSGNLTRDPELRQTSGGTDVCGFRLANNTRRKDGDNWVDKPNYFDVTVWSGMGRWVAEHLSKGDRVVVDGRVEWREWEDNDGKKRQAYDIIAESVVLAGESTSGGGGGGGGQSRSDVPADTGDLPQPAAAAASSGSSADDDIPF